MDSFKFHDARAEKSNAISRQRRIRRITALFRFLEMFIFLFIISRFSTQLSFSLDPWGAYFRRASVDLISPRFVFFAANTIVAVLLWISGRFSSDIGGRSLDCYDEYVRRSRSNRREMRGEEGEKSGACRYEVVVDMGRKMRRCRSENLGRRGEALPRSVNGRLGKGGGGCGKRAAGGGCSYAADEMSNEEFRRTVEEFIARQQRVLREEEDVFSAVVSL